MTAELVEKLRTDLAGFTVDAVNDLLGPIAQAALGREQSLPARLVVAQKLTTTDEPLAALVALFVLGLEVPAQRLANAVPGAGVAGLSELGLVSAAGHEPSDPVRALVDLRPYATVDSLGPADWWLASDLSEVSTGRPLTEDHVLGVGGASLTLARSTVRRPTGRVLDLGTGCGIQALHAARHSEHVVATDISARALQLARFNWALNQATTIEGRQGSLLEPVAGELFDQVVSNPPFVITPRSSPAAAFEYRDGGMVGDDLVRQLVETIGSVLAPGGIAQFLGNWEGRRGEGWTDRVSSWLDASGLDGWVVQREWQDPAEYAETWIRDSGQHLGKDADDLYAAWLADFASRGVDGVGFGLITLRRPVTGEGPRLKVVEERRTGPGLPWGDEVLGTLERHDWLSTMDDSQLLSQSLRVAGDVTEERHHLPGAEDPSVILLRQGGGAGRVVQAGTALAGFVGASSGDIPVGRLIAALASLLEVDAQTLGAELLTDIRGLVRDGLLEPTR